jgi:hypothetical protein
VTRLEVEIGDVVLRGVPPEYGAGHGSGFGALVEDRIGALARGESRDTGIADREGEQALADLVAEQVWDRVRRSIAGLRGEQP